MLKFVFPHINFMLHFWGTQANPAYFYKQGSLKINSFSSMISFDNSGKLQSATITFDDFLSTWEPFHSF